MNFSEIFGKRKEMISEKFPPSAVLLHSCCAPCSGAIIEKLHKEGIALTIFFYNPNIHPRAEYDIRKTEIEKFAKKNNISFVDADYHPEEFFEKIKGLENEPERGKRCEVCFQMRLDATAQFAANNGFSVFAACLGISRWKNRDHVNACGHRAAAKYGVSFWDRDWRKEGGEMRKIAIAKQEEFYAQQYCGCAFSLRDTNAWRAKNNRLPLEFGQDFYENSQENFPDQKRFL